MKNKPSHKTFKMFTFSDGTEVKLRPVSKFMIDNLKANRHIPSPPSYVVKLAGGGEQTLLHDETTIKNGTPEELVAWREYIEVRDREAGEFANHFFKLVVFEGVDIDDAQIESGAWIRRHKFLGLTVPEDLTERRYYYIMNELLKDETDGGELMADILNISNVNVEAVKIIRDSFRIALEEARTSELPEEIRALVNSQRDGNIS